MTISIWPGDEYVAREFKLTYADLETCRPSKIAHKCAYCQEKVTGREQQHPAYFHNSASRKTSRIEKQRSPNGPSEKVTRNVQQESGRAG